MTDGLPILCDKCRGPLERSLVTLPYEQVAALRRRVAELEARERFSTTANPPETKP
jgi:hypothetical protein